MRDIRASVPVIRPPEWAVLQRRLFADIEAGWRAFEATYTESDGRLYYTGAMRGRDGVDDFYEPFFNWPTFYLLGGSDAVLAAAKRHWEGVTRQMTEIGFVADEYESGYDWFHQGESQLFFYALCAADPADLKFRERALRFASYYLPGSHTGNYDAEKEMIRTPHSGSRGPRYGIEDDNATSYDARDNMRPYGLPLDDVEGIREYDDLRDPDNARRMGQAMYDRMGRGDVAVNLASTALVANAWLYDHQPAFRDWIMEYVGAWRERAEANGGLIPDNVGPSGEVGELHSGNWYGGHYGWGWPHGLQSVECAVLVAATVEALVACNDNGWDIARVPLDTVLSQRRREAFDPSASSLGGEWKERTGAHAGEVIELIPYRRSAQGWFDWMPVPIRFVFWLWWSTLQPGDKDRLDGVLERAGYDWRTVVQFRDKEESGHEASWYAWLTGQNPDYPIDGLLMALGQVSLRMALIRQDDGRHVDSDIHWWQDVNPVVTEVLSQQVFGAPGPLYNGGLPAARVRYWDKQRGRPGLPADVAALVDHLDESEIHLALVNLDPVAERALLVQAGGWGEDRIDVVEYDVLDDEWPGRVHGRSDVTDPHTISARLTPGCGTISVDLPPLTKISLRLSLTRRAHSPQHQTYSTALKGTR